MKINNKLTLNNSASACRAKVPAHKPPIFCLRPHQRQSFVSIEPACMQTFHQLTTFDFFSGHPTTETQNFHKFSFISKQLAFTTVSNFHIIIFSNFHINFLVIFLQFIKFYKKNCPISNSYQWVSENQHDIDSLAVLSAVVQQRASAIRDQQFVAQHNGHDVCGVNVSEYAFFLA